MTPFTRNPASRAATGPNRRGRPATAVILDVDGTLVDSNDAHAQAWLEAFGEAGLQVEYQQIRWSIGMGGDKLLPHVAGISKDSPLGERISERRAQIFKAHYVPHLRPFPGVRELVERFARDGHRVVVASSAKEDELGPLLDAAGVSDLIEARTSSDDADESKPDPDIVQAALQRSGVEPRAAIMLGDTPYDVEAATRAGIAVVGVECGGWGREHLTGAAEIYHDPADLLSNYDRSAFARSRHQRSSSAHPTGGRPSPGAHPAAWLIAVPLLAIGVVLLLRAVAPGGRRAGRERTGDARQARNAGLGPRERAELRDLITRTS